MIRTVEMSKIIEQDKLWDNALQVGVHELAGFIDHDNHDYTSATENFYVSLAYTLPWISRSALLGAAAEKTEILRFHDQIEESGKSRREKLKDSRWSRLVLPHAKNEAKHLGLSLGYAKNKTEFYRLHGQMDERFRYHVYEMERNFSYGVTKNPKLYLITAPIYLACVAFHDNRSIFGINEHDEFSKRMMQLHYADYVFQIHNAIDYKTKVLGVLDTIK